jgi:hypothetical protein
MKSTSRTKKAAARPSPKKSATRAKPPAAKTASKKPPTTRIAKGARTAVPKVAAKTAALTPPRLPRRVIFIDVENTSSETALLHVLEHLAVDRTVQPTEVIAIGNWKSVGTKVARTLASLGAQLMHSAPTPGVRDWSDLWIAVNAGRWLAQAAPGDRLDLVSDDRAFDAVRDTAASLGVECNRISYRHVSGAPAAAHPPAPADGEARPRRPRRRGGRGRGRREAAAPRSGTVPAAEAVAAGAPPEAAPAVHEPGAAHAASQEQIRAILARLTGGDTTRWINLDLLANALKAEGFSRPPGSPRLITRVRGLKGAEVTPTGMVRIAEAGVPSEPAVSRNETDAAAVRERRPRRRGGRRHRPRQTEEAAGTAASRADDAPAAGDAPLEES